MLIRWNLSARVSPLLATEVESLGTSGRGILPPMEATCIWLFPAFVAGSILWAVSCKIFYRIRGEFGKDLVIQRFGQHAFHVVSGDYSSKLIYEEIFRKKVYLKHGVSLDGFDDRQDRQEKERRPCGPLVLDVGGNLGFFSAFVAEHFRGSRPGGAKRRPYPLKGGS